jgi:EAL domain-containing protein (putative c-di-GMP-specific phosphodiesterase class I)/AmiR/NasT family two-component response regulator
MIHLHGTQSVAFRVLIVNAEAVERTILARCVEMLGWTADTAGNPDEAAAEFSRRRHNVVVADLRFGEQDGTRLLRQLRRDRADPAVIFVSSLRDPAQPAALRVAHDLGLRVSGTLARPVDPYRLHALLLSNPVRKRGDRRLSESSPNAKDLDQALTDGEIHTEYQPKTDLITGEIVGVEALARWRSPILGLIPPDQFVPVAEQSDLINRLTYRVLEDAVVACRQWREVRPGCSVAVNISPYVLANPGLLKMVDAILDKHGMPPDALIAEVTESTLLSNLPVAVEVLTRLSIKGVRVSMDGFGTGCSSVLSLLRMPFTELKIDRSFVGICRTDPEAWRMVRTTVSLARELGMHVVAEGIETEDVSDRLRDVGCDTGQGWYFGRPMQDDAMLRWLTPDPAEIAPSHPRMTAMPPAVAHHGATALQS